jgi:hypothetical protein
VKCLAKENLDSVAALDLYEEYDEGLAERDRGQRLILAWTQNTPTGRRATEAPDSSGPHCRYFNAWAEFAGAFTRTHPAFLEHERAKAELKGLVPADAASNCSWCARQAFQIQRL